MPLTRLFESEEQAREAAAQVEAAGYDSGVIFVVPPSGGAESDEEGGEAAAPPSKDELIKMVSKAGKLGQSQAISLARDIASGKTLVVVGDPLGYLYKAERVLDAAGAENPHISDNYYSGDGGKLFSTFPFGFPLLTSGLMMSGKNPLMKSGWTVFNSKLSNGPFLEGKLGFKSLSQGTFLSGKLGFKELSSKRILYKRNVDS